MTACLNHLENGTWLNVVECSSEVYRVAVGVAVDLSSLGVLFTEMGGIIFVLVGRA